MSAESLFSINKTWEVLTLGEICKRGGGNVQTGPFGSQLHAADYVDEGIPSIMPKNIGDNRINEEGIARIKEEDADRLSKYLVREGDIIYSRRGDVERRALIRVREDGWLCGTGCLRIRFGEGLVYPPYAAYYLGHPLVREWIVRHAHGATMPNLNTSILSALPFVLPDMEEQIEIANIFDGLDNKIEINRQTNQTLENIAQAIFKSWFVDFEPTRAKIAARQAYHNLTPAEKADVSEQHYIERAAICAISGKTPEQHDQLNPETQQQLKNTAALFPDALVESELGEMPEGWEVRQIQDLAKTIKGKSYKSVELEESSTALVTLKSFNRGGGYRLDGLKEYTGKYKPEQEVFAGDLIIAYTDVTQAADVIGKPAMVVSDSRYEHLVISLDVAVVRPEVDSHKYFLYGMAKTDIFQKHTLSYTTGTTVLHLGKTAVPEYKFAKPSESILEAYKRMVAPMFDLINERIEESKHNERLRDLMLPKLLSGEVAIGVPESTVEVVG